MGFEQINMLTYFEGSKGPITVAKWASEQCALTGSADGTIRLWDARDGSCIKALNGQSKTFLTWSAIRI